MIDQVDDYFMAYKNKVKERYQHLYCDGPVMTLEQIMDSMDKLGDSVLLSEEIIKEREENKF